jgi:hypothetical protein
MTTKILSCKITDAGEAYFGNVIHLASIIRWAEGLIQGINAGNVCHGH